MNVHFIAWMSITLTFLIIGGGAYTADALFPHDGHFVDIWSHPPFHSKLAHMFFFCGGLYAVCNFIYHLVGLRRVRRDLRRAKRRADNGLDLGALVATSRAREGTGADRLVRLDLETDSTPRAFERALMPRVWEIGSAARELATTAVLAILVGLFAMVMECMNAARGMALTGTLLSEVTLGWLGWIAAAALDELATGLFVALTCAFGFHILREGARDAAIKLERYGIVASPASAP